MTGKRVKPDDVERIVGPIVDAIGQLRGDMNTMRVELVERLDAVEHATVETAQRTAETAQQLQRVERNTADTADAVRALERAAVGVGRMTSLEDRVRRIEEHVGLPPAR